MRAATGLLWRWVWALLVLGWLGLQPAQAVILTVTTSSTALNTYQLQLQVGAATGVDTVNFSVTGNNVGVSPTAVQGSPDISVSVLPLRPLFGDAATSRPVTLTVDASAGMVCQTSGCAATVVPFSKVSWTASNNSAASTGDIQSGSFTGSAAQQIARFESNVSVCSFPLIGSFCPGYTNLTQQLSLTHMRFFYANDSIYPAGTYLGTVRFTATLL